MNKNYKRQLKYNNNNNNNRSKYKEWVEKKNFTRKPNAFTYVCLLYDYNRGRQQEYCSCIFLFVFNYSVVDHDYDDEVEKPISCLWGGVFNVNQNIQKQQHIWV